MSSSRGSLENTRELLLVRPGTPSPLSSVSSSPSIPGSDSSVESNSPGLQNTAALLRVPPSPRSSSDSISPATRRRVRSSSSSRSRGRALWGSRKRKVMFRIRPRVGRPMAHRVPMIDPPPRPLQRRPPRRRVSSSSDSISPDTYRRLSSSSSTRSRGRGRAAPASTKRKLMVRIGPPKPSHARVVPFLPPPPPWVHPSSSSSSSLASSSSYYPLTASSSSSLGSSSGSPLTASSSSSQGSRARLLVRKK